MRVIPWIRAEIRDWLGVESESLGVTKEGSITFNAPHPDKVEGREALKTLTKSRWAIALGAALFGAIVSKLL